MSTAFDPLDAGMVTTQLALFGQSVTLKAFKDGASGPNAPRVADPGRADIAAAGIRSEYADRIAVADNGFGRQALAFKTTPGGKRHIVTLARGLAWTPQVGDRVVWADMPDVEFVISEPLAEEGGAQHFVVNRK